MSESLSPFQEQTRELESCKAKLLELARLLRNTDRIEPPSWGVCAIRLLEDVQEMYPREYRRSVADR